jgi:hypothetical protein
MKKIVIFLALISVTLFSANAQSHWSGFWRPVEKSTLTGKAPGDKTFEFKFRPAASMTAVQFSWNKDEKLFESSTFSSAGLGFGLQHYVEKADGSLVNNYGFNALIVLDGSQSSSGVGVALTASALRFVSLGGGYSLTNKQFFLLTGIMYNF